MVSSGLVKAKFTLQYMYIIQVIFTGIYFCYILVKAVVKFTKSLAKTF